MMNVGSQGSHQVLNQQTFWRSETAHFSDFTSANKSQCFYQNPGTPEMMFSNIRQHV
jgi:hypothetical protein